MSIHVCWVVTQYERVGRYHVSEKYSVAIMRTSVLIMETVYSYKSALRYFREQHKHLHCRENLKSHMISNIPRIQRNVQMQT